MKLSTKTIVDNK